MKPLLRSCAADDPLKVQMARAYALLLDAWQDPEIDPILQTLHSKIGLDVDPIDLAYIDGWRRDRTPN